MENKIEIGFTKKPHGLQGEIKVNIRDKYLEDFLNAHCLFLNIKGSIIPYFVESIRSTKHVLVKFEEVDTISQAEQIAGKSILIQAKDLIPEEEKVLELDVLQYAFAESFMVIDVQVGKIGAILRVEEFPQQEMAFVEYNGQEVLIPLNDALIVSIDKTKKEIIMNLPEGLLSK